LHTGWSIQRRSLGWNRNCRKERGDGTNGYPSL
jgi:hypothetical protein